MKILEKLPEENIRNIISFCEITTLFSLRRVNKQCLKLPNVNNNESYITTSIMLPKFLKYIGHGEQDKAEAILKVYPDLALAFGDLTDCAGRICRQVTGFQYAVWALDWHMWKMLQRYMPIEEIKKQLITLDKEGIDVKEPGSSIYTKTKQISWQNLIEALEELKTNWDIWDSDTANAYWCRQVGGAQLLLPAHVINEYTSPQSFYPSPDFKDTQLLRTGIDTWYFDEKQPERLLGKAYAWFKMSRSGSSSCFRMSECDWGYWLGLTAISYLYSIRIEQRVQFITSVVTEKPGLYTLSKDLLLKCVVL